MRLYHSGNCEIRKPDIHYGRRNADFGQGFYLTPDKDFVLRWAGRDALINSYELDMAGLVIHRFEKDAEWFEYIFRNRRLEDRLDVDVVIGPVANDTIFDTMGILSSGFLSKETCVSLLQLGPEYIQLAIKSEKAVRQLRWTGSESNPDYESYAAGHLQEQEAYQELLAKELERLEGGSFAFAQSPSGARG